MVDTLNGEFKVYYFPLMRGTSVSPSPGPDPPEIDNFDRVYSCIKKNGVSGCYHLATRWA